MCSADLTKWPDRNIHVALARQEVWQAPSDQGHIQKVATGAQADRNTKHGLVLQTRARQTPSGVSTLS